MQSSTPAPSEVLQDTAQAAASNSAQCSYVAAANASESSKVIRGNSDHGVIPTKASPWKSAAPLRKVSVL